MSEYPEQVLGLYAQCPLLTLSSQPEGHYPAAQELLRWALLREFEGDRQKLAIIREKYCLVWKSLYYPQYKNTSVPADHPTYWEGPRKSRLIGKKVYDFVTQYEVLHPMQPYSLAVGSASVSGEYALVRRRTAGGVPMVLIPHSHPPLHKAYPDMLSLARWLHARRQILTSEEPGILHFPLTRGDIWRQGTVNERLVQTWLQAILEAVPKVRYASPGSHCQGCVRYDCLEAFRNG